MLDTKKKITGSYYTPNTLTQFIITHLSSYLEFHDIDVLEPSVGEGAFLKQILQVGKSIKLTAIDINEIALNKAKDLWPYKKCDFIHTNFIQYDLQIKFDLIIGNPPYIDKTRMETIDYDLCRLLHIDQNMPESGARNIWTSFVIKSNLLLKEDGIMSFILPAEMLQVKYATPIINYLKKEFVRIEIFTIDDILFECKGQRVVLLFAFKRFKEKGFYFNDIKSINNILASKKNLKKNDAITLNNSKWSNHHIKSKDIEFLYDLKNSLYPIYEFCKTKPGIVTAANDFFIIDNKIEKEYEISEYTIPIIKKSSFVNGGVIFKTKDLKSLHEKDYPTRLLHVKNETDISTSLERYLLLGIENGIPSRYKCLKRDKWYVIPNILHKPEAFFFRRSHLYPKLMKNNSDAYVTDSAYIIEMNDDYSLESFIFSFYNSVTLCFTELDGRRYGGGVLELTPLEFKGLPLPYYKINKKEFSSFNKKFRFMNDISNILDENDSIILESVMGLDKKTIFQLHRIRRELLRKRIIR